MIDDAYRPELREFGIEDGESFFENYGRAFKALTALNSTNVHAMIQTAQLMRGAAETGKKVVLIGNGGSAALAAHIATDLTKNGRIPALSLTEPSLVTCLSNDFSYEDWMTKALELLELVDRQGVLVAISASGRSPNVCRAAMYASERMMKVVALTGFEREINTLWHQPHDAGIFIESRVYNIVESVQQYFLGMIVDLLCARDIKGQVALSASAGNVGRHGRLTRQPAP